MILRAGLLVLALAAPALAEDLRATCEPETFAVDRTHLSAAEWAEVEARTASMPNATGRLWRVTSPEGAVSHLWGTIHNADIRLSALPAPLLPLIDSADLVMLEIVGDEITFAEAARRLSSDAFYDFSPHNLLEELPDPARTQIRARMSYFGVPPEYVNSINLERLFELMLHHPCGDRLEIAGYPLQTTRVEMRAMEQEIPLQASEPRDLLATFATANEWRGAFVDAMTLFALYQTDLETIGTVAAHYQRGELGRMVAFDTVNLQRRFPALDVEALSDSANSFLIVHRNLRMVQAAFDPLSEGGVLMVSNAYNLPGETGLVALLRDAGFVVERVPLPGETTEPE